MTDTEKTRKPNSSLSWNWSFIFIVGGESLSSTVTPPPACRRRGCGSFHVPFESFVNCRHRVHRDTSLSHWHIWSQQHPHHVISILVLTETCFASQNVFCFAVTDVQTPTQQSDGRTRNSFLPRSHSSQVTFVPDRRFCVFEPFFFFSHCNSVNCRLNMWLKSTGA